MDYVECTPPRLLNYQPCCGQFNVCVCGNTKCTSKYEFAYQVADALGIDPSQLSRWLTQKQAFLLLAENRNNLHRLSKGQPPQFVACEDLLYERFLYRRLCQGLTVDNYWLRAEFRNILNIKKPKGYITARLSNGWLCGFLLRYNISNRMKTEKKMKSVAERIDTIRQFHKDITTGKKLRH